MTRLSIRDDRFSINYPALTTNSTQATPSTAIADLGVGNLNYSAGIWVKQTAKRLTFGNLIFRLVQLAPFKYAFSINSANNGLFTIAFYDGTLNPGITSVKSYPMGEWQHVVFTRSGTTVKIYVDGVLSKTQSITIGSTDSNNIQFSGNSAFAGNVSSAFIYGRTLTDLEIETIYANDIYPSGALLRAKLNEGSGTTALDTSGNGVNFTLTGATWSTDTPTGVRTATGTRTAAEVRPLVNQNLVYNGDFSIVPAVNVPQTTAFSWLNGTATGILSSGVRDFTGKIYGIYYWDRTSGTGSIMIDTTEQINGKNSLKISPSTAGTANTVSIGDFFVGQYISVLPNTSYTLTGWMKTNYISGDANSGARFYSMLKNGARGYITTTTPTSIKTTTDWTFYTTTFTTGATVRFAVILMQITGNNGAATLLMDAWFADIVLKPTTATVRAIA